MVFQVRVKDGYRTVLPPEQTQYQAERCRLSRSVWAQETIDTSLLHLQAYPIKYRCSAVECVDEAARFEEVHFCFV